MSSSPSLESNYLSIVDGTRDRVLEDEKLAWLLSSQPSEAEVLGFLIHFCGLGVRMVQPVEDWILRAGTSCEDKGFIELGRQLRQAAAGEAGHQSMLLSDLDAATSLWNARYTPSVTPESILGMAPTDANRRYIDIHENNIASDHPYCQLGIEHEIEMMSLILGPPMISAMKRAVGGALGAMSFIREHVELDQTHTKEGMKHIISFLSTYPTAVEEIARTGAAALHIYLDFLGECIDHGRALAERASPSSPRDA